jgi:hypothetical protein
VPSSRLLPIAALALSAAAHAVAQPGIIHAGATVFADGTILHHVLRAEPPLGANPAFGMAGLSNEKQRTGRKVHRYIVDHVNHQYFGYDVTVLRIRGSRQYRVTIEPLSLTADDLRLSAAEHNIAFTAVRLVSCPPPQILNEGDTLALDLLVNPATGQKLVEYIQVSSRATEAVSTAAPSGLRDFQLENVEMHVSNPLLFAGGKPVRRATEIQELAGPIIWLAIPEHGRFLLSIVPRPGYDFRKAGSIEGNAIRFEWEGEHYEWTTTGPILGQHGPFNLYVLHEPAETTSGSPGEYTAGATTQLPKPKENPQ